MGNTSFWIVEGVVCVPLGLLVWASQRVYNSLLPSRRHLLLGPVLPRAIVLLILLFVTCLLMTCLFLVAVLSAPGWQTRWSDDTLWQALSMGSGLAIALVVVCANLARTGRARRASGARRYGSDAERQEDAS